MWNVACGCRREVKPLFKVGYLRKNYGVSSAGVRMKKHEMSVTIYKKFEVYLSFHPRFNIAVCVI